MSQKYVKVKGKVYLRKTKEQSAQHKKRCAEHRLLQKLGAWGTKLTETDDIIKYLTQNPDYV